MTNGNCYPPVTERATEEIRFLGDLQRLTLKPGDHFVLMIDEILSDETATRIKYQFEKALGKEHRLIVLGKGMKLGVVGAE